jgi:hypothetical protein
MRCSREEHAYRRVYVDVDAAAVVVVVAVVVVAVVVVAVVVVAVVVVVVAVVVMVVGGWVAGCVLCSRSSHATTKRARDLPERTSTCS